MDLLSFVLGMAKKSFGGSPEIFFGHQGRGGFGEGHHFYKNSFFWEGAWPTGGIPPPIPPVGKILVTSRYRVGVDVDKVVYDLSDSTHSDFIWPIDYFRWYFRQTQYFLLKIGIFAPKFGSKMGFLYISGHRLTTFV